MLYYKQEKKWFLNYEAATKCGFFHSYLFFRYFFIYRSQLFSFQTENFENSSKLPKQRNVNECKVKYILFCKQHQKGKEKMFYQNRVIFDNTLK